MVIGPLLPPDPFKRILKKNDITKRFNEKYRKQSTVVNGLRRNAYI